MSLLSAGSISLDSTFKELDAFYKGLEIFSLLRTQMDMDFTDFVRQSINADADGVVGKNAKNCI
jgi:hypothetical protein